MASATSPIELVIRSYELGYAGLLLSGRSIHDFIVTEDGKIRPMIEALRCQLRGRYGMHVITYSMAQGLDWGSSLLDESDRQTIERVLRAHHLFNIPLGENETVRVVRGIDSLCRTPTKGLKWANGQELHFAFLFLFGEHLTPGSLTNGTQTDAQLVAIELAHLTGQSLALRSSGNLIMFNAREGLVDQLVSNVLQRVQLPQPDLEEKKNFCRVATTLYEKARFDEGLTADLIAHLTTNTPNRGLECLLRASHRGGGQITGKQLAEQKARDVVDISEGTLKVLETDSVRNIQLSGHNVTIPLRVLGQLAEALDRGDQNMQANVLLVGPHGTGKTDMARLSARRAGAAAYQILSPKSGIVGETERKAELQQSILRQWIPNVAFADEVTESLPLERPDFNGDSGASAAVTAALLTALSDETRRGRSLFIATTNCPWRMGAAMRSRFTAIPVLHPLREDFAAIVVAIAQSLTRATSLKVDDPKVRQAASLFYDKGASPRDVRKALSKAVSEYGPITPESVLLAAGDLTPGSDLGSIIYTDLWAIKVCSFHSYHPWNADPAHYPYPQHLQGIVDPTTGEVNRIELDKRIQEYKAHANV